MQTIEHTKLKPLSVAMTISTKDRRIIGFRVASLSRKKYGNRPDHRRREFAALTNCFNHDCLSYTPLNRTSVHSPSPSYLVCFQGRSTNNLKGKKAASLVKVSSKKWFAAHSFALLGLLQNA